MNQKYEELSEEDKKIVDKYLGIKAKEFMDMWKNNPDGINVNSVRKQLEKL